jgi:hypothetical protein
MLRMKITDIQSNGFFLSTKNTVLNDDSLINALWILISMGLVTTIGLPNLLYLFLFILSTKVLSSLDDLNKETKINLLLNLVKFWSFSYLIDGTLKLNNYLSCSIFNYITQIFISTYLIKSSYNWFEDNNMLIKDSEKSGYLTGSISIVDKVLSKIYKLYSINTLVLNYLLNIVTFLSTKTYHSFDIFVRLFKKKNTTIEENVETNNGVVKDEKLDSKENLIEKDPIDNTNYDKLLESITEDMLNNVNKPQLDSLDDDNYNLD